MGMRNRRREAAQRLNCKSLDAKFLAEVTQGLNCSPFEAVSVLEVVKEVYAPYLDTATAASAPGKMTLVVVSAEEPAGKPLAKCQMQRVCLTVHRGKEDDRLLQRHGPAAFRRARIADLCQEALSQGGLLTAEDLAYRTFFVTPRTITRDLKALRETEIPVPLRSIRQDIGPVLTHRTAIVQAALDGKTTSEICYALRHSAEAVANYLSTFARCVQLQRRGLSGSEIAFVLRRGPTLIESYLQLSTKCAADPNRAAHLEELLRLGQVGGKKKLKLQHPEIGRAAHRARD